MEMKTKSILMFGATLIIGIILGVLISGFFVRQGVHKMAKMRTEHGIKERIIDITDADQQQIESIDKIFERRKGKLESMLQNHRMEFMKERKALIEELDTILDDEQMEVLQEKMRRMDEFKRRGPHGPHGHRGGPPAHKF